MSELADAAGRGAPPELLFAGRRVPGKTEAREQAPGDAHGGATGHRPRHDPLQETAMIRRRIHPATERMTTFIPAAALLAALGPASLHPSAVSAQEVELRWKFEPDTERVYEMIQTSRSASPMGEMNQTQTSKLRQQVLAVADDGAADVRVTYESMRLVQDGPMGHQEFDSESGEPPADPLAMMMSQLVGVSFEITVAPDGEVRRVSGTQRMTEAIAAGLAAANPDAAAAVGPMIDGMFTDETMRSMMQQGMQTLPDGPVAVGATWQQSSSVELPIGTMRSDAEYTLEEVVTEQGRRIARIGMRGTTGALEPNPSHPSGAGFETPGGAMTGEIDFDVDRGVVRRSTLTMNMEMSSGAQSANIESNVEMTLIEG